MWRKWNQLKKNKCDLRVLLRKRLWESQWLQWHFGILEDFLCGTLWVEFSSCRCNKYICHAGHIVKSEVTVISIFLINPLEGSGLVFLSNSWTFCKLFITLIIFLLIKLLNAFITFSLFCVERDNNRGGKDMSMGWLGLGHFSDTERKAIHCHCASLHRRVKNDSQFFDMELD